MKDRITRDDIAADIEQDIARARTEQRHHTANGQPLAADDKGDEIDALLDERTQYSY